MTPDVTVVMPAFRAGATIGAAISGVLTQTHRNVELVVVDDGSDDDTAAIVAAHGDDRVRLVSQPNQGVAVARNTGIEHARADLIAFCDADDILLPSHIEAMLELHRPRTIVTGNAHWLFPGGISRGKVRHKGRFPAQPLQRMAILEQNFVSTMSLFPRALVDEIGGFDHELRRAEDWDFWLRAIFAGNVIVQQPVPHALYRWTSTSLSASFSEMDADVRRVLQRASERSDLEAAEREYLRKRLEGPDPRQLFRDAEKALRDGRPRDAAPLYAAAAELLPSERPLVWKARLVRLSPRLLGSALARRERRGDEALGFDDRLVR